MEHIDKIKVENPARKASHAIRCVEWKLAYYKENWRNICAILPLYLDDGTNGCVVYYTDGDCETYAHRLVWVVDDLLAYLCTSRKLLRDKALF